MALQEAYEKTGGGADRQAWATGPEAARVEESFRERHSVLWEQWRASHVQVRLLASWRVLRLSDALVIRGEYDWDSLWEGHDPYILGGHDAEDDDFGPYDVFKGMQHDLGVEDGADADPGPGTEV